VENKTVEMVVKDLLLADNQKKIAMCGQGNLLYFYTKTTKWMRLLCIVYSVLKHRQVMVKCAHNLKAYGP